jgi:hypothetical protein
MVKKCIESINNGAKPPQKGYTLVLAYRLFKRFQKRGAQKLGSFIGACNLIFVDTCFINIVTKLNSTYYIVCLHHNDVPLLQ